MLIGLGKESGEIEYAADSVSVAIAMPRRDSESARIVLATPKLRAGLPAWSAFTFDAAGLQQHADLQGIAKALEKEGSKGGRGKKAKDDEDDGDEDVLDGVPY